MEFRKVLALRGPNIWSNSPVLEAWVDLQELKDKPSNAIPGLYERLTTWLPGLIEHRCGLGVRGGGSRSERPAHREFAKRHRAYAPGLPIPKQSG